MYWYWKSKNNQRLWHGASASRSRVPGCPGTYNDENQTSSLPPPRLPHASWLASLSAGLKRTLLLHVRRTKQRRERSQHTQEKPFVCSKLEGSKQQKGERAKDRRMDDWAMRQSKVHTTVTLSRCQDRPLHMEGGTNTPQGGHQRH